MPEQISQSKFPKTLKGSSQRPQNRTAAMTGILEDWTSDLEQVPETKRRGSEFLTWKEKARRKLKKEEHQAKQYDLKMEGRWGSFFAKKLQEVRYFAQFDTATKLPSLGK
eukprot:TRINITY_DN6017_c0_g1_i2.p2 TRINITY_DN6017_c0_g1~~TRINITY_DN6017_c0_g1_i2.p2  ORF type:complete len:110 (-),score=22.44 TRINITY_DN6017_c0_g1_i2:334-663(-)